MLQFGEQQAVGAAAIAPALQPAVGAPGPQADAPEFRRIRVEDKRVNRHVYKILQSYT